MLFCHVLQPEDEHPLCLPQVLIESTDVIQLAPTVVSNLPALPFMKQTPRRLLTKTLYKKVQFHLFGKELLFEEMALTWEEWEPFLRSRLVTIRPGLQVEAGRYRCQRCHSNTPEKFGVFPCVRCGKECTYCRHCLMMGRITACTPLFRWIGPPPPLELKVQSTWEGVYSAGQELAAAEIVSSVQSKTELLVWAVCGAGKTEILFPAIEQSLQKGEHVLIATPRTDVVLELAPRLSRSFPGIPVTALHGKSDDKNSYSPFVVATTHQTMRFTEAFDTVIVDEVDAFPYTADEALVQAVNKAKKQDAAVIYLTATPTPELIKRTQHKRLDLAKIPRRFHGHPLPVPRFKWCGPWRKRLKKEQLPAAVSKWCRTKIAEQTPVFLFVSSVAIMEKTTSILQKLDPAICGVHSADKERHEKVKAFREGEIPILITTTILERGVTIPGAEAAVFGAEDSIFTESALVQIAGRVGRSHEQPDGEVLFFHFGKTKAMAAAHKHIKTMNALPFLQKEVTPIGKEEST